MRIFQRKLLTTGKLNIHEDSYRKRFNLKGLTLIELMCAIFIFTIIIASSVKLMSYSINYFKNSVYESREDFYINEFFRYVEQECTRNCKSIEIADNSIIIERFNDSNIENKDLDIIKLEGKTIVIRYTTYGYVKTINNVLKNITSFSVYKKNNVFFIEIKTVNEREYQRCYSYTNLK
jgi:prepilin-type N-terminal cleavage/methylation domain-containing protein